MKLEFGDLPAKLQPLLGFTKRYVKFMFFIGMLFIAIFLVYRINQFNSLEPSEDAVSEKLQTVQRPRLDPAALETIKQLETQNIEVQSIFDQARNNPFSE